MKGINPGELLVINNELYFMGYTDINMNQIGMWKTNGSADSINLVKTDWPAYPQ